MEYRKNGNRIVLRLARGEEVIASLAALQRELSIGAASVAGIGATDDATVGVYAVGERRYHARQLTGDMEITALVGNLSMQDGKPYQHLHVTLAGMDGNALGGHLNRAVISATAEIFITVVDCPIGRRYDDETGLNLMTFAEENKKG